MEEWGPRPPPPPLAVCRIHPGALAPAPAPPAFTTDTHAHTPHPPGFTHAAFVFGYESLVHRADEPGGDDGVPPGALVSFVQKGLQYLELEANVGEVRGGRKRRGGCGRFLSPCFCFSLTFLLPSLQDGAVGGDFAALTPSDLLTKDVDELKKAVAERRERRAAAAGGGGGGRTGAGDGPPFPPDDVTPLDGHTAEVFTVAWAPAGDLLASGASDGTARLWRVGGGVPAGAAPPSILRHTPPAGGDPRDVTTLHWSPDGATLASGSYDGCARLWSRAGQLLTTLAGHGGPVFSLAWAPGGAHLLSGSVDRTAIVWDVACGAARQEFDVHTGEWWCGSEGGRVDRGRATNKQKQTPTFSFPTTQPHTAPILDVAWRDDAVFATSSSDRTVRVCEVGTTSPGATLRGHTDEVNAVAWAPGTGPAAGVLASASDDGTARLWRSAGGEGSVETYTCASTLEGHAKEIYAATWAPAAAPCPPTLATASFDATVKLWDAATGACTRTLARHSQAVYSASFSPDGRLLATAGFDRRVHVWSVDDGALVRTFAGRGGAFDVAWAPDGARLAAAFADRSVTVLDVRV